jgi:hypothetical protein
MKKFIFIPVVNNFNLLEKAVRSVKPGIYDEYIIFNNSGIPIDYNIYKGTPFRVWFPNSPKTFMETQNAVRKYAIKNQFDYYSFMHNDGEINDNSDLRLINYVESLKEPWGVVFTHYDVFCAFNTEAVKEIGEWGDLQWPEQRSGYFLDNDYYRRLKKGGYKEYQLVDCQVSHFASNTIKDEIQNSLWVSQQQKVMDHYKNKWGDLPPNEVYDIPFNGVKQ